MSLTIPLPRHHLRQWATVALVLSAAACVESQGPDSFIGLWRGSSSVFTQFQLNFQAHTGEAVWGSALFIFAQTATTVADTDFVAAATGDSLAFTKPVPAFTGHNNIEFRGRHSAARIEGIANGVPIVLERQ